VFHTAGAPPRNGNTIRAHIGWAQELASQIDADERFERTAPTPLSTVCFRLKGADEANRTNYQYTRSPEFDVSHGLCV
jgi:glutamate/tyrosine decarboxylase-like PLP-dependent enzyme